MARPPRNIVPVSADQGDEAHITGARTRSRRRRHRTRRWRWQDLLRGVTVLPVPKKKGKVDHYVADAFPTQSFLRFRKTFLWRSILLGTALYFAAHYWNQWQQTRLADRFLALAEQQEKAGHWPLAQLWLENYLAMRPGSAQASGRLARVLIKKGANADERAEAIQLYRTALVGEPTRTDWKTDLAVLLARSNPPEALEIIDQLLKDAPNNASFLAWRARIMDRAITLGNDVRLLDVIYAHRRAIEANPADIELSVRLALLLREHATELAQAENVELAELERRADWTMDELVLRNRKVAKAYLERHSYQKRFAKNVTSSALSEDITRALALEPGSVDVLLAAAEQSAGVSLYDPLLEPDRRRPLEADSALKAEEYLRAAVRVDPEDARPYLGLSLLAWIQGRREDSLKALEKGIELDSPSKTKLLCRLASARMTMGQWRESADVIQLLHRHAALLADRDPEGEITLEAQAAQQNLMARWYLAQDNPRRSLARATSALQSAAKLGQSGNVRLAVDSYCELGRCRSMLGQWDLAIASYKKAAALEPSNLIARVGEADCLRRAGRLNEAANAYQRILDHPPPGADPAWEGPLWLSLAKSELSLQARLPAPGRRWDKLDQSIAKAKAKMPQSPMPLFLEVESWLARGKDGEAKSVSILDTATKKFGQSPEFWTIAFEAYWRMGRAADATKAVESLERLTKQPQPELRSRLDLLGDAGGENRRAEFISSLARGPSLTPEPDTVVFADARQQARLQATYQTGGGHDVDDLGPILRAAEDAVARRDPVELAKRIVEIRDHEGPEAMVGDYFEIHRLLIAARGGDPQALDEANRVSRTLLDQRPTWSLAHTAAAMVLEAKGAVDGAAAEYREAYRLGEVRPEIAGKLASLYLLRNREREASQYLSQMPEELRFSPQVLPLAVLLAAKEGSYDAAQSLAERAMAARPTDPLCHLLMGRVLVARRDEALWPRADAVLQRALELAPADPRVWVALLHFHVASRLPDRAIRIHLAARGLIDLLRARSDSFTRVQQAAVAAICFELRGDFVSADNYHRKAFSRGEAGLDLETEWSLLPDVFFDSEIREVSSSLWGGDLRTLPVDVRQTVGLVLRGSPGSGSGAGQELVSDKKLNALAYFLKGGPDNRQQGKELYQSIADADLTRGDLLLIARASELDGDKPTIVATLKLLVDRQPTFATLAEGVETLLRIGHAVEARRLLDKMEAEAPNDPRTIALSLRYAAATQPRGEALAQAERTAKTASGPNASAVVRAVADTLADMGEETKAVSLLAAASQDGAGKELIIADWHSRRPNKARQVMGIIDKTPTGSSATALAATTDRLTRLRLVIQALDHGPVEATLQKELTDRGLMLFQELSRDRPALAPLAAKLSEKRPWHPAILPLLEAILRQSHPSERSMAAWIALIDINPSNLDGSLQAVQRALMKSGPLECLRDRKGTTLDRMGRAAESMALLEGNYIEGIGQLALGRPTRLATTAVHLADAYRSNKRPELSQKMLASVKGWNGGESPRKPTPAGKRTSPLPPGRASSPAPRASSSAPGASSSAPRASTNPTAASVPK